MATLPSKATKDIFTEKFDGVFGRFKTADSFELAYLQTSLRVAQISKLVTASDAFDFRSITFEEVVQRDIDMKRVDEEIIGKYLVKGKNRVIFFPPLLVSVVAMNGEKRIDVYDTVEPQFDQENSVFSRTWDRDKFRLDLNVTETVTGHSIEYEGNQLNYLPYAATLAVNPDAVKLVVIDGQHRFTALRRIWEDPKRRPLIEGIELPICIFFTPDAIKSNGHVESIVKDLRELFVTVNTTSKEVSGHFTVLLNDRSLASLAAMSIANLWKQNSNSEAVDAILPLLEWNTRDAKKAGQRLKPYSITTISIIADSLKSIFEKSSSVQTLLRLTAVADKLNATSGPPYSQICEDTFSADQDGFLKIQVADCVTPALNVLLTELGPYSDTVARFSKAVGKLTELIDNKTPGAKQFRDDVLYKFRNTTSNDIDAVKDVELQFESSLTIPENQKDFFLAVFQDGLMRAWAELCLVLVPMVEMSPMEVAKALTSAINAALCKTESAYLERSKLYFQPLLFEGEKVKVSETTRTQWKNFILAFLATDKAQAALETILTTLFVGDRKPLLETAIKQIAEKAESALSCYLGTLQRALYADYDKNWRFKDLDEVDVAFLNARYGQQEHKMAYQEKLQDLSNDKFMLAKESLANALGRKTEEMPD